MCQGIRIGAGPCSTPSSQPVLAVLSDLCRVLRGFSLGYGNHGKLRCGSKADHLYASAAATICMYVRRCLVS